jgi:hypothetical protein
LLAKIELTSMIFLCNDGMLHSLTTKVLDIDLTSLLTSSIYFSFLIINNIEFGSLKVAKPLALKSNELSISGSM